MSFSYITILKSDLNNNAKKGNTADKFFEIIRFEYQVKVFFTDI